MGASASPTSPLQQQSDSSLEQKHPLTSTPHLNLQSFRTNGICTQSSSSAAWMKPRRTSPSSSPPSSSSSSSQSSDSLSPTLIDFKRSRHLQRSRSPALFSLQSAAFQEPVDDCPTPGTEIIPPTKETLTCCPHQTPSSARSTHPPLQENISHPMDIVGMRFEDVLKSADVDKEEDKRKLRMWRTACAMAHAYIHQRDAHRHDLHRHELHHRHEPSRYHGIHTATKDGPNQQEEVKVRSTQLSDSGPDLAPLLLMKSSHGDEVCPSSMCDHLNDVVCIDEVVNPTQAAEWFGALFLSNSTLVS